MSRIGKKPIAIPKGVEVTVDGTIIRVKGPKESKELDTMGRVNISLENGELRFGLKEDTREGRAFWGTYRALANNMIMGMVKPFEKKLEINGVGYRAAVNGKNLEMQLGYSHPVVYPIPAGVEITVDKNIISIKSSDKQVVGQIAAEIRSKRPPEPYKGKGIKYVEETIRRKAGKTSKK
ncbi:MAG: 50S ribosomal protein L6 [Campylobacterales bacterium]